MELKEVFEPIIKFIKGFQKKETENSKEKAKELLIMGFIDRFREELPMEYAVELNQLLKKNL